MLFSLEDFRVLRREACQSFQVNHGNNFLVCKPVLTPTAVQCVVPSTMRLPRFCPVTDIVIAAPPLNIFVLDYTQKELTQQESYKKH